MIADACQEVGVRVVCAYGVTDRHGEDGARRGLEENERFIRTGRRGMVGVHAAFTCSDDTLAAAAGLAEDLHVGVHIHVAEGVVDADAGARLGRGWPSRTGCWPTASTWTGRCPAPGAQPPLQHEQLRSAMPTRRRGRAGSCSAATVSGPTCSRSSGWPMPVPGRPTWRTTPPRRGSGPGRLVLVPEALEDRVRWSYDGVDDPGGWLSRPASALMTSGWAGSRSSARPNPRELTLTR